ncbi:D-alanyl-D-alanine carboxypeptidase / D-alanyl-D-alanine-endopeptidase (penicillin-binding protein 4) [Noviherbaspirillum humi]|uniref:D-alanyl-D-alanine carboxypeptidase / D-alanyl-D-alanine-endopeptidase (Penicillin-binding protein 4) n=2 Tax=Noviherbaspirillum humi TaxID=1688639 RepID=A0A239J3F3_9BURK|nr:D-alanyl-D-alanine carboxypeptidase / D-alanyl-D-alanine-endopeptidase (penicillin-binding protein 4) [Noviherbaspirillum humi]
MAALLLPLAFLASAGAQELPPPVDEALRRAEIPNYAVGAYVQEVGGGQVLTGTNWNAPFNPASVMKLLTTNAALDLLGPTFTWKTQAYADGPLRGDVLQGDLVIKGSGDPKLVMESLWLFLRQLRARGIREIRGSLVLDRSAFEEAVYDPAQFDSDPIKPYNAGPDALLLNYKSIGLRFLPDEAALKVNVLVDPPLAGYRVAPPKFALGDCTDWRNRLRLGLDTPGQIRFDGAYAGACGDRTWYIHPFQMTHVQYFDAVFRHVWGSLGGTLTGPTRNGAVPPAARLVAEWESAPLADIIRDINKFSNNVMARQLLLTLANQQLKLPATPERGAAVIDTWLARKGIQAPELVVRNGSGLSREERISALTLGRLLVAAFQAPTMPEFISSMPLAGLDGTMRQRLNGHSVAGRAHIKTGTLNEVRAIAGYVLAASGRRYAVAFLVNHANAPRAQEAQDAMLQWVYEQG